MAMPWWLAFNSATLQGYVFQAPDYRQANIEAKGSGDTVANAQGFSTKAQAVNDAKSLSITLPGNTGGQGPQPPPDQGGSNGKGGTLDQHTIETVTQWVVNQIGHCYTYGGSMGSNLRGCGDCSNFCNEAWGLVGGQAIPGYSAGTYDGVAHGPSTVGWLAAQGGVVGSVPRSSAQAGDLATWQTHMGFCINNDQMVSAQNPTDGVRQSGIDGFIQGEQLVILRLAVIGPGGISFPVPGVQDAAAINAVTRQIAESSRQLVSTRMRLYNVNRPVGRA